MMSYRSDVELPKGASGVGYIPYIIITLFVVLVVVLIKFACYFLCYFWLSFLYKSLINFLGYGQTLMSESMSYLCGQIFQLNFKGKVVMLANTIFSFESIV